MTGHPGFDSAISRWMDHEAAAPAPPSLLSSIISVTSNERPRPVWLARLRQDLSGIFEPRLLGGWGGKPRLRVAWVLVAIALMVGLLTAVALVGSHRRLPAPFGPAANGWIVYSSDGDIYLGDPLTQQTVGVMTGPEQDSDPTVSPDGTRFAFLRSLDHPGDLDVVVADIDGSHSLSVTRNPLSNVEWLDWTPDSQTLGFVSEVAGRPIFQTVRADGSALRTLVDDLGVGVPSFRPPDGSQILFRGRSGDSVGLFVIDSDGTHRRTLIAPASSANPERALADPRYSPDGLLIAYQQWSDKLQQMRVYVMNADGSGNRELPHDPRTWYEGWPVWSPDGTHLAIQRLFGDAGDAPGPDDQPFAVIAVDGRSQAVGTGPPMSGPGLRVEWSPDGLVLLARSDTDRQVLLDPGGGPSRAPPWDSTSFPAWQRLAR